MPKVTKVEVFVRTVRTGFHFVWSQSVNDIVQAHTRIDDDRRARTRRAIEEKRGERNEREVGSVDKKGPQ